MDDKVRAGSNPALGTTGKFSLFNPRENTVMKSEKSPSRVKIILDTLGADSSPSEIIAGGVLAAKELDCEVIFSGRKENIKQAVKAQNLNGNYSILDAPEAVSMHESPAESVRRKKNSSLVRGLKLLKDGANAFVSAGNTGAVMAASLILSGRIGGIDRPGIASIFPTLSGEGVLVIDVGANPNCTPENLKQFALMGSIYSREVLGVASPTVGLLSIGTEKKKGNKLTKATYELLENSPLNFVGNVESHRLITQKEADVVVCDGFAGNVLLKAYEGGASATIQFLKKTLKEESLDLRTRLGAYLLKPSLSRFKEQMSPSQFGGAPLLGVKGITIIAHGQSNKIAIKNAIKKAHRSVEHDLVGLIEKGVKVASAKG